MQISGPSFSERFLQSTPIKKDRALVYAKFLAAWGLEGEEDLDRIDMDSLLMFVPYFQKENKDFVAPKDIIAIVQAAKSWKSVTSSVPRM